MRVRVLSELVMNFNRYLFKVVTHSVAKEVVTKQSFIVGISSMNIRCYREC